MPAPASTMVRVVSPIGEILLREEKGKTVSDFHILRAGDWVHDWYGEMHIDEETFDEMLANFAGPGRLPVDYNHGSACPSTPEEGKAAGWIQSLFKRGADDLWAVVEWTAKAVEYIKAGEYKFASAQFDLKARSKQEPPEEIGAVLSAAALCVQPWIPGLTPVALAAGVEIPVFYRPATTKSEPRRLTMDEKRIREILSLPEGTAITEDHRNTALSKLDEQLTASRAETAGIVVAAEATDAAGAVATLKAAPEAGKVVALGAGRVIVSKAEHERLTARATKADELERTTDGKILLTAAEHGKLVANAASGADASRKLFAKEVDDLIETGTRDGRYGANLHASLRDIGMRDVDEADAPALREKNLKQLRASIEAHPKGTISFTQAGQDGDPGQATEIGAFIAERETAHLAAKRTATEAISLAHRDAEAKFGKAAFERYQYGDAAVVA